MASFKSEMGQNLRFYDVKASPRFASGPDPIRMLSAIDMF
jgi:hypothetical protein